MAIPALPGTPAAGSVRPFRHDRRHQQTLRSSPESANQREAWQHRSASSPRLVSESESMESMLDLNPGLSPSVGKRSITMQRIDTVVVGAGLAGLNCARELSRQGHKVLICEAAATLGGRIRTEQHEGFLLDFGFEVLQTAYPEARRSLDYTALDLRPFRPGALIRYGGKFHRISDPWRDPLAVFSMLFSPIGRLSDKWRMALLRRLVLSKSIEELYERPETTAIERLREFGFSPVMIERFFRPFLGGVFFDPELSVSSRAFEFIFQAFSAGDTAVPANGMAAIPRQIAAALPAETIRTNTPVSAVDPAGVSLASGERIDAGNVVVATDSVSAARLLGLSVVPATRGTTCVYFAAPAPPIDEPMLVLNATGKGRINNVVVPSLLSAAYAPGGQSLIAVNVLGIAAQDDARLEADLRRELGEWFGNQVTTWRHLKTLRIPEALPLQVPPVRHPRHHDPHRQDGILVCGEFGNPTSIQWALYTGRRAAEAILTAKRLPFA
ncbi:MAG: FAD-dependent oxidoreductase [Sulfuritalea sp.]|nr:FAD-dependent oxidoreductase [Sulfuritalea sp.]